MRGGDGRCDRRRPALRNRPRFGAAREDRFAADRGNKRRRCVTNPFSKRPTERAERRRVDRDYLMLTTACSVFQLRGMKPANEISPEDAQAIEQLLIRANALAEKHLESPTLSENAPVRAWRQAYQQFKTKRGARCSIENLLKRVLKGNPVGSISP